jgi:hypothetical protein
MIFPADGWKAIAEDLKMMHGIDISDLIPPKGVLIVEGVHEIEEKTEHCRSRNMQENVRSES